MYEIRNAQDYFGVPVVAAVYNGGLVRIPLSGLTVASPVGLLAPLPTGRLMLFSASEDSMRTVPGHEVPLGSMARIASGDLTPWQSPPSRVVMRRSRRRKVRQFLLRATLLILFGVASAVLRRESHAVQGTEAGSLRQIAGSMPREPKRSWDEGRPAPRARAASAAAQAPCDNYASPSGTGNGLFSSSPFKISDFWPVASPGKTLCLLDGTYTGAASMILPPQGLSGAAGIPITIRALNDGKVLINGQGIQRPVLLLYNDWFVIEGINACCSTDDVVGLSRSNNNIIRRVAAWDAADANTNVFSAHLSSSYNLFEDVAGWGTARKIFSASQGGDYTTIRRAWGRWERSTVVGPKMTYTLAYNNYHLTCENCLGTWSGQGMPETYVLMGYDGNPWTGTGAGTYTNYAVDQPYGIFSVDRLDGDKNANARLLGSLAYVLSTDTYKVSHVVFIYNVDSLEIKDTAAYIAPGSNLSVLPFGLYGLSSGTAQHLIAENLTAFGGAPSVLTNAWLLGNVWAVPSPITGYAPGENILNTARGANLAYRYQDGSLTDQPLWPWPMNQRIIDGLAQSGRPPVDVTATLVNTFFRPADRSSVLDPTARRPAAREVPSRPEN